MATQWLRRTWLLAASASALLLAGCGGGGSIESQLNPTRIVAFGDAMADLGQDGGRRYTVNDGSINNWTLDVAQRFGRSLAPSSEGGLSFATGNARVTATPGAGGDTTAPTVQQQIDSFLSADTFGPDDLVLVSAGTSDVIVQARAALAGEQSREQMLANLAQAGADLGAQVRRLVAAGARHVVVAGPYNLGRSVWAKEVGQPTLLLDASTTFNTNFLVSVVDLGARVLYADAALQFNLFESRPGDQGFMNVSSPACTVVDPGPGIGTGDNQVNSLLCTPAETVAPGNVYDSFLFADRIYPTPRAHRAFGQLAYERIRERW